MCDDASPARRMIPLTMMKGTTIRTEMMRTRVLCIDLSQRLRMNGQFWLWF